MFYENDVFIGPERLFALSWASSLEVFPGQKRNREDAFHDGASSLPHRYSKLGLSCLYVFVESCADGAFSLEKFLHHAFDPFAEPGLVKVDSEDVFTAVEISQARKILVGFADCKRSHDSLEFLEHGVR